MMYVWWMHVCMDKDVVRMQAPCTVLSLFRLLSELFLPDRSAQQQTNTYMIRK